MVCRADSERLPCSVRLGLNPQAALTRSGLAAQVKGQLRDALGSLVLGAAFASLAWPLALLSAADVLDGPWALAQQRADRAGALLADALLARAQGHRPVTLVGFGMGARVVLACLRRMHRRGAPGRGIVETAVCLGTPAPADPEDWLRASEARSAHLHSPSRPEGPPVIGGGVGGDWSKDRLPV